ncbi:MAG: hypothetical protein ACI37S_00640 [Candidatus Gastranaerophilaceae bacterium]
MNNNQKNFYTIFLFSLIAISSFTIVQVGNPFKTDNSNLAYETDEATLVTEEKDQTNDNNGENSNTSSTTGTKSNKLVFDNSYKDILVNRPTNLSYKSKKYVYDTRKKYVMESIFAKNGYEPSEEVFGSIESGKPWIENNQCKMHGEPSWKVKGPSEETRFINNPAMLVAIEFPFSISNYPNEEYCQKPVNNLEPASIKYSKEKNEIVVIYDWLPYTTYNNHTFYTFNGLNARDLGYKYAYIEKSKSTYIPDFMSSVNMANNVIEFVNYIHVGGSCGIEGGCNNGSPRQSYLEFKENFREYKYRNKEIYIKLWKNKPKSADDVPDIVERIIFRWS